MPEISLVTPFPLRSIPRIWSWIEASRHTIADDFAPKTLEDFIDLWATRAKNGTRSWGVMRDGELGGVITSSPISPVVADLHCIFKKEFWGHKTTVPATRMAMEKVFAEVPKITSLVFSDNHAILGNFLGKLNGVKEGVLTAQTMRDGKPTDMVLVAIHREAFNNGIANGRVQQLQRTDKLDVDGDKQLDGDKEPQPVPIGNSEPPVQLRVNGAEQSAGGHSADHGADARPN